MDSLSHLIPALNKTVDISVSNVHIQEFLRSVANASGLNLNIDPELNQMVSNNFQNVKVRDMLVFLERNYPLEVMAIGNIINVSRKESLKTIETDFRGIRFDTINKVVTLDYFETDIAQVAKELTKTTKNNVILSPSLSGKKISSYIENMSFRNAMEQLAYSNDLELRVTEEGYFILESKKEKVQSSSSAERAGIPAKGRSVQSASVPADNFIFKVSKTRSDKISLETVNAPLKEVIMQVGEQTGASYILGTEIEGVVSMSYPELEFESFLRVVLTGTSYTFKKENNIYVIGKEDQVNLKGFSVYQFHNRTTDDIMGIIPDDMKEGLVLHEYKDLNSILISGVKSKLDHLYGFFKEIDKPVPVVLIDVIIIEVKKSYTISTGIDAGLGEDPVGTRGQVFPKVDIQMGADELNKMVEKASSFGVINIGSMNANFYVSLKALEEQGILKINSTPQLATLNGHEATLTIGTTEYYLEEQSNFIGTQNPQLSTSQVYKPINAELFIKIRPVVSGDDQITLDIEVGQSDFTERISNTAPPGSVTRNFKSIIRIKNQETIILGGLEQKKVQDSASGIPLVSRIPVIKWLFSSRTKVDANSKLTIFIQPTIIG